MPSIDAIAGEFTAMLRAGLFGEAGEKFWAANVVSIEPIVPAGMVPALVSGKAAARAKATAWFAASRIDELCIDGPFVTGDQFALFIDMAIVDRASGAATPFTEIALYTVRDGEIAEERYFYA